MLRKISIAIVASAAMLLLSACSTTSHERAPVGATGAGAPSREALPQEVPTSGLRQYQHQSAPVDD